MATRGLVLRGCLLASKLTVAAEMSVIPDPADPATLCVPRTCPLASSVPVSTITAPSDGAAPEASGSVAASAVQAVVPIAGAHSSVARTPGGDAGAPRLRHAIRLLCGHLVVALVALVVIGGATRVMEAGLACPDWPLCYGSLLPGGRMNLQVFLEWFHRLDAFVVGVALLVLAGASVLGRRDLPRWLPWAAGLALLLVAVQGGLGALTVLRLLAAGTVTAHLATGLLLVLLLSAISQAIETRPAASSPSAVVRFPSSHSLPPPEPSQTADLPPTPFSPPPAASSTGESSPPLPRWWLPMALLAGFPLFAQCLLGGAMASRWAVDRCLQAGEACQWLALHRQVAGPAALSLALLAVASCWLPSGQRSPRLFSCTALLLVAGQVALGIASLRLGLSQPALTIAHQLLAALLVALIGAIWGVSLRPQPQTAAIPPALVSTP
jgi:cytochrome c oxidase assembly protein subunit 15